MTYSCTDFTSDVLRCLVEVDALDPTVMTGDDLRAQSDLAVDAIFSLHRRGANPTSQSSTRMPVYAADRPILAAVRLSATSLSKGTTLKRCSSF